MVSRRNVRKRAKAAAGRVSSAADRAREAARNAAARKKLESYRSDEVTDQAKARRERARMEAETEAAREAREESLREYKRDVKKRVKDEKRRDFETSARDGGFSGALSRFAEQLSEASERQRELDAGGEFGDTDMGSYNPTSEFAFGSNPSSGMDDGDGGLPGLDVDPSGFGSDMGFDPEQIDDRSDFDPSGMGDGSMGFDPEKMRDGAMEFDFEDEDRDDPFGGML